MKTLPFIFTAGLGLAAITYSGCSHMPMRSTGPDAARPIGGKSLNILELREDVKATRLALNTTTDALNRIPGSPAPMQAYDAFRLAMTNFQKLADKTLKESDEVRSRGRELFAEWAAETDSINDPEIRRLAEDRRVTLNDAYNTMMPPLVTARNDLSQARSDLTDIQKALALDLTPDGINLSKAAIDRVNAKAATAVQSLDALSVQLDKVAAALPYSTVKK